MDEVGLRIFNQSGGRPWTIHEEGVPQMNWDLEVLWTDIFVRMHFSPLNASPRLVMLLIDSSGGAQRHLTKHQQFCERHVHRLHRGLQMALHSQYSKFKMY